MNKKWIPWVVVVALALAWWWWTQKQKRAAALAAPSRPPISITVQGGTILPTALPGSTNVMPAPADTAQQLQLKGYNVVTTDQGVKLVQMGKAYAG